MPRPSLDEIFTPQSANKKPSLDEIFGGQPVINKEPTVGGIFGKVPESKYAQGERNILGNIFERPGAAVRSAIRGQGYSKGAINPSSVPTFQEELLDKYYNKVGSGPLQTAGGFLVSGAGMAADIATNPVDVLGAIVPLAPGVKQGAQAIKATKAGQLASKVGNYPIEKAVGKTGEAISSKLLSAKGGAGISSVFNKSPEEIISVSEKQIDKAVRYGIAKGIRPGVSGKLSAQRNKQYFENVKNGVKLIVTNKDNLVLYDNAGNKINRIPKSTVDYAQAIEQTKQPIYQTFTEMAEQAGEEGAKFNANKVIKKLTEVADDLSYNPQVRKYAVELTNEVGELQGQNPLVIQNRIRDLNESLAGYYDGRVNKAKARLDGTIANLIRQELDDMIEKTQGEGYQALKNAYGALITAEKEVNHRAVVLSRAAPKNVFDLTDMFTGEKLINGILTLNPANMTSATGAFFLKRWYKKLNSPDYAINNMFSQVDKVMTRTAAARSAIPGALNAELVESLPTSGFKALPGRKRLQIGFKGERALPPGTPQGEGFTRGGAPSGIPINLYQKSIENIIAKRLGLTQKEIKLLPQSSFKYGKDFTARGVKFADKNKTSPEVMRLKSYLRQGAGEEQLRQAWDEVIKLQVQ